MSSTAKVQGGARLRRRPEFTMKLQVPSRALFVPVMLIALLKLLVQNGMGKPWCMPTNQVITRLVLPNIDRLLTSINVSYAI